MKKDDFEKAKVIGKVDLKNPGKKEAADDGSSIEADENTAPEERDDLTNLEGSTDEVSSEPTVTSSDADNEDTEATADANEDAAPEEASAEGYEDAEESFSDIVLRSAAEHRVDVEKGEDILSTGSASSGVSMTKPTVSQMVAEVKNMLVMYVIKGLEAIGDYLLPNVFDGNYKKALSKDPYKGTSLNDLARHKDMPLSRQRLGECIRAAAITQELTALGLILDSLTYFHKVEISRLRSQEARVKLAKEAHEKALTVQEVRDRVRSLTTRSTSADKRMAHAVIRQLGVLAHLSLDEDTKEFLLDKDRLRAALSTGETAKMLDNSEKFRDAIGESEELLHQLEKTLVEIVVERRKEDESEPAQRLTGHHA